MRYFTCNDIDALRQPPALGHGPVSSDCESGATPVAVLHTLAFVGVVVALWRLFTADELLHGLRWGVVAILLMRFMTEIGGHFGTRIQANRILHAVTRLELRLVRRDGEDTSSE